MRRKPGQYFVRVDGMWYLGRLVHIKQRGKIIQQIEFDCPDFNDGRGIGCVEKWSARVEIMSHPATGKPFVRFADKSAADLILS